MLEAKFTEKPIKRGIIEGQRIPLILWNSLNIRSKIWTRPLKLCSCGKCPERCMKISQKVANESQIWVSLRSFEKQTIPFLCPSIISGGDILISFMVIFPFKSQVHHIFSLNVHTQMFSIWTSTHYVNQMEE